MKHLKSFYHHGGIKPIIDYRSKKPLSEERKEQIIRLIDKGMTQPEIALRVGCSANTVANYKNYNPKIEKQNTKLQNGGKSDMTIKEIEKKIAEQESALQELKMELEKAKENENKIPDDVKDIPLTLTAADYKPVTNGISEERISEAWYADKFLNIYKTGIDSNYIDSGMRDNAKNHTMFPNKEFAEMYRKRCQLIADMLHFKWLYDRGYIPNWNDINECKYIVSLKLTGDTPEYTSEYSYCYDYNCVYFSTERIAEKCVEWLNYLYKKGKYAE